MRCLPLISIRSLRSLIPFRRQCGIDSETPWVVSRHKVKVAQDVARIERLKPIVMAGGLGYHRDLAGMARSLVLAPVAQLDRALPSEGRGREFESRRVRQCFHFDLIQ